MSKEETDFCNSIKKGDLLVVPTSLGWSSDLKGFVGREVLVVHSCDRSSKDKTPLLTIVTPALKMDRFDAAHFYTEPEPVVEELTPTEVCKQLGSQYKIVK